VRGVPALLGPIVSPFVFASGLGCIKNLSETAVRLFLHNARLFFKNLSSIERRILLNLALVLQRASVHRCCAYGASVRRGDARCAALAGATDAQRVARMHRVAPGANAARLHNAT